MIGLLAVRGIAADAAATSGPNTGARLAREAIGAGSDLHRRAGGQAVVPELAIGVEENVLGNRGPVVAPVSGHDHGGAGVGLLYQTDALSGAGET